MLPDLVLGMKVKLRKPHPCGSYEWEIVRLGADIGLVCAKCGHKVLLSRRDLSKRLKAILFTPAQDPSSNEMQNIG
jgi:hypothetical protein